MGLRRREFLPLQGMGALLDAKGKAFMVQETFFVFWGSAPERRPGRVWVVCFLAPGAPRLCGRGPWSPPSGAGSRLCRVLLAVLAPALFVVLSFLLLGFVAVPSLPLARVAFGLLVGAPPPALGAGGVAPAVLAFRFRSPPPWLHLVELIKRKIN